MTEPSYFNGLKREKQIRAVEVVIDDQGGTPKTLVERAVGFIKAAKREAKRAKDSNLKYDEVWCVFDVDEHPKLTDARQQASAHGIQIAMSNPCFELWLVLHFREQHASIHRHDIQNECQKCIDRFEKEVPFSQLRERIDEAIRRAIALEEWQETRGNAGSNPSTTVHRLVQRLKQLGKTEMLDSIGH